MILLHSTIILAGKTATEAAEDIVKNQIPAVIVSTLCLFHLFSVCSRCGQLFLYSRHIGCKSCRRNLCGIARCNVSHHSFCELSAFALLTRWGYAHRCSWRKACLKRKKVAKFSR